MGEKSEAIIASGPFSLREVAIERFGEFFESIIEQAALTEEQQTALAENLKGTIEKRDKLGNCLAWIDAQAEMLKAEEKRLAARRGSFERFAEVCRSTLKLHMENMGVIKVEGLKFSFAIRKNPPKVEIFDEDKLPASCFDYKPVVVKERVKDGITDGSIPVEIAKLTQGTRLEIK